MPTCTELERKLLDKVIEGEPADEERSCVILERITPELRERAVVAHMAVHSALEEREAVWAALLPLGVKGKDMVPEVWKSVEREAKCRLQGGD